MKRSYNILFLVACIGACVAFFGGLGQYLVPNFSSGGWEMKVFLVSGIFKDGGLVTVVLFTIFGASNWAGSHLELPVNDAGLPMKLMLGGSISAFLTIAGILLVGYDHRAFWPILIGGCVLTLGLPALGFFFRGAMRELKVAPSSDK